MFKTKGLHQIYFPQRHRAIAGTRRPHTEFCLMLAHCSNIWPTFFQSSSNPKCLVTRFVTVKTALVVTRITSITSSSE